MASRTSLARTMPRKSCGQTVEPLDQALRPGGRDGQALDLAGAQVWAGFQDEVAPGQGPVAMEGREDLPRQGATAGPELQDVAPGQGAQGLATLGRQAAAEQGRQLRGGGKVPRRPQLGAARGVIAEPGGVEGQLHEAVEGEPPTAALGLGPQQGVEALAEIEGR